MDNQSPLSLQSEIISAIFGGGGIASWLILRRKTLESVIDAKLKTLLGEYQRIYDDCQRDRDELRNEIAELRANICYHQSCRDRSNGKA